MSASVRRCCGCCESVTQLLVSATGIDAGLCGTCNYHGPGDYWKYTAISVNGDYVIDCDETFAGSSTDCSARCRYVQTFSGGNFGTLTTYSDAGCGTAVGTDTIAGLSVTVDIEKNENIKAVYIIAFNIGGLPHASAFRAFPGDTRTFGDAIAAQLNPHACTIASCADGGTGIISDTGSVTVTVV